MNASSERSGEYKSAPVSGQAPDKQAEEDLWTIHKAERYVWSEKMLRTLARGVKGGKWFSLIDKIYSERTLSLAWQKVRSKAGACGVDGITIEAFAKDSESRLLAVNEHLKRGSYQPKPVKRVRIPKPGSKETRPLGIPTVTDRVVQQAMRLVLEPIYEHRFAAHSYGFRPGRSCHDALRRVNGQLENGHTHVVDIDIQGYFDTIDHERLMKLLKKNVSDGRVLEIIERLLKAGVLEDGTYEVSETGTPQGGVISPLLSNIYLDELDHLMERKGYAMTRYADDMLVQCKTAEEAESALETVHEWMRGVGLKLHAEKTRVVNMAEISNHFDFLGYRFKRLKSGRLLKLARPKSVKKLRENIRTKTKRNNKHSMKMILEQVNPILRGWFGYFKQAYRGQQRELDGWIRMRLRSIYRKRHRKRGRGRSIDHHQWPNSHFAELGLFSLEAAQVGSSPSRSHRSP